MNGILVLDKPAGISSHDAVQRARRLTGIKRIGHLGTLDPIGTGVLPLVVGKATRLAQFFLKHDRAYEAEFRFGFATDTYDSGGEPTTEAVAAELSETEMEASLEEFRGEIVQTPPPVSAKKIGGVPAYKLARKKKPVVLEPVNVTVHELALLRRRGAAGAGACPLLGRNLCSLHCARSRSEARGRRARPGPAPDKYGGVRYLRRLHARHAGVTARRRALGRGPGAGRTGIARNTGSARR